MPFVHVSISKELSTEKFEEFRDAVAERMSLLPGKSRLNTMIRIDAGCRLTMGDEGLPCAFLEARLYKSAPVEAKRAFVQAIYEVFETVVELPSSRVYMNIIELETWASGGVFK